MNAFNHTGFMDVAIEAAMKAGDILKADFGKDHIATFKTAHDIGLEIDKRSEKIILELINRTFPSHSIYSEEIGEVDNQSEYTWFIDPLDGTNNYYAGIGYFGISIALKLQNDTVVGVVYNPVTNQMFCAAKDSGATLNGERISPSEIKEPNKAVFAFIRGHRTYDGGTLEQTSELIGNHLPPRFRRTLNMWAPALDWCLLAMGGIDVLVSFESELEDQYAGTLIAQEAGAEVINFEGKPYDSEDTRIIATNPFLKKQVIELLRNFAE